MEIRYAIIDDDDIAITVLKSYLDKIPQLKLVGFAQNAIEGHELLLTHKPDLLFLDVEMPQLSGIELLQTLHNPPKVIITSAKKEYAAEGFDLNVLDYIVKPVTFQRLSTSIRKFLASVTESKPNESTAPEFLFLKENKKMVKVNVNEILYIESVKDYIKIITSHKTVITKEQLGQFESRLPNDQFLRIHRSYLVSIQHIDSFSAVSVEINGVELPIGRNYKDSCYQSLTHTQPG